MGDAIRHHGILGMKWGIRRTAAQLGRKAASPDEKEKPRGMANDEKKQKNSSNSSKSVSKLTDEELKSKLSRIKLEDEYTRLLMQQHERSISKGRKFLNDAIGSLGKQVLDKSITKLVNKLFETKDKDDMQQLSDAVKRLTLEAKYKELANPKTQSEKDKKEDS